MQKLLPTLVLVLIAGPAFSQVPPTPAQVQSEAATDKQQQIPKQEQGSQETATSAAREARKGRIAEGANVTWDRVMAHPDDIDLNYRFALTQVREGNLRGAAATLERLLMINPALHQVRLVYAIVLYRLDNIEESARELDTLSKESLPESMRNEVKEYQVLIDKKRRKTHVSAALSLGFGYDDNKNFFPASGQYLFGGTPIGAIQGSHIQHSTDFLGIGNVRITRDLPSEAGHQVFGNVSYVRDELNNQIVKNLDIQAFSVQAGGVYKTAFANFTPTANFDHVLLGVSHYTFLRNRGAGLRMDKTVTSKLVGHAETIYTYQNFVNNLAAPTADQRSGPQVEGYVGGDYVLTPTNRVGTTVGFLHKSAANNIWNYNRGSLSLSDTWLLGKGMFLASSLTINLDYYEHPDQNVSTIQRIDKTFVPQAVYGVPLGFIAKPLDTTLFTLTYRYYHALSTIMNYAYTDNRIAGAFIYQFNY